jgi:transketolase
VRVVGIGGGFDYGPQGTTHHGLEDVGVMRIQPGMTVVAPADHQQCAQVVRALSDVAGPAYLRLGKDETAIPGLDGRFELGRAQRVRCGADLALIAMGGVATEAAAAADLLAERGVQAAVWIVASVQPAPAADLAAALAAVPVALSVEAHYVNGGLGSLVAEVAAERGLGCRLVRCGVQRPPDGICGSQRFLYDAHGVSRGALVQTALGALGR